LGSPPRTSAAVLYSRSTRQVHSDARFFRPAAAPPIGRRTGSSRWFYSPRWNQSNQRLPGLKGAVVMEHLVGTDYGTMALLADFRL
jgi:hypothetical protein